MNLSNGDIIYFNFRDVLAACFSNPCLNQGICEAFNETTYFCDCPAYYAGARCEIKIPGRKSTIELIEFHRTLEYFSYIHVQVKIAVHMVNVVTIKVLPRVYAMMDFILMVHHAKVDLR